MPEGRSSAGATEETDGRFYCAGAHPGADFCERQGDDWVFMLGGAEVARLEIGSILSIPKAPRDFV